MPENDTIDASMKFGRCLDSIKGWKTPGYVGFGNSQTVADSPRGPGRPVP